MIKNKNNKKKEFTKHYPLFRGWEICLLLILAGVNKGLFVENQVFNFSIGVSIILILLLIYRFLITQESITLPYISIGFLLIALTYLPSLSHAESFEFTLTKMIEWCTYALALIFFHKLILKSISNIIIVFSSFFAIAHFFLLYRVFSFPGGIMSLGEELSGSGIRLAGFLQYPNATATIIGSLMLYGIQRYVVTKESSTWRIPQFTTLLLLGYLFLMTESRGAWLVLAICFIFSLGLVERSKQVLYIYYMSILMVFALISYSLSSTFNLDWLLGCFILFSALATSKTIEKFNIKIPIELKSSFLIPVIFPILLIVVGLATLKIGMLPNALQSRLTTNLSTFSDRFIYMKDGYTAIQDNYLLGAGGEAWRFKMYQVQSAPYIVQDVHNFYLQHWLEVGLIGLLIVVVLLITAVAIIWRGNRLLLPPILMIIIHACFDFTLSYGISIILLAIFIIEGMGEKGFLKIQKKSIKQIYTTISIVLSMCCLVLATLWIQAESLFNKGQQTQNLDLIDQAIEKNPYATRYMIGKYPFSNNIEQVKLMETLLIYEPRHALALFQLAESEYKLEQFDNAIKHFEQSLEHDHFDRQKYEKAIGYLKEIENTEGLSKEAIDQLIVRLEETWRFYEGLAENSFIRDQRSFLEEVNR